MIEKISSHRRLQKVLTWGILIVLTFVPRMANLGLFLGHDEEMRNRQSLDSFLAIVEGRWGDVYSSNFGGTNLTWARTGAEVLRFLWLRLQGVDVSLPDMANYGPQFDPLPGAVFNGLLIIIIYWFAREAFGRKIALVAAIFLALDPYLLSESRILRTEAAYAMFITLTMISLVIYVRTRRRLYLAWVGFWLAWTIATKISGVLLAPIIGLVLLCMLWDMRPVLGTTRQRLGHLLTDMLIGSAVTLACTFAIWPTLWVSPLETFTDLYQFTLEFGLIGKPSLDFFFMGGTVDNLPPLYYLLVLLYKTTPLVWLGLGAFAWELRQSRREKQEGSETTWVGVPFPLAGGLVMLLFGVLYSAAMSLGTIKTERYMMAPVCTWGVSAAIGLVAVGGRVYGHWQTRYKKKLVFWMVAFAIFFAGHGLFAVLNHPYYFSYYNPLLGGGPAAVKMIQVGSGEGLDIAMDYLNKKPDPQRQTIVCGTNLPRCEYLSAGQTILKQEALDAVHSDWIGADYVVTYIFQEQRGDYPSGVINYLENHPGPEYTATFQGIKYAQVYPAPHAQYVAASELTGISILLGYDLDKRTLTAGDSLRMKFYWESDGRIEHDMFVQLTDADNYIWSEGVASFLPGFEGLNDQIGAVIEGEAELPTSVGMPPGRYYLKMGYKTKEGQLIGQFELPSDGDTIEVTLPEIFSPVPDPLYHVNLDVDGALMMTGYDIEREQATPGESLWLLLYWRALKDIGHDYVISLRLLDANDKEKTYLLGRPARSSAPTDTWQAERIVQDPWRLTLPDDIAVGQYQLELVIFDAQTQREVGQTMLRPIRVVQKTSDVQSPTMQFESGAQFGESLTLLGYELFLDKDARAVYHLSPGFYWQSHSDFQGAFDILVTLRSGQTGQVLGKWRVPLYSLDSSESKTSWKAGEIVYVPYQLELRDLLPEGSYDLDLALFNRSSGRLEPVGLDGNTEATFLRIDNIQDKVIVRTANN
jgi:hypothetical protein